MSLIILAMIAVVSQFLRKRLFHVNEAQFRWGWLVLAPIALIWLGSLYAIERASFTSPLVVEIRIGVVALSGLALVWSASHWVFRADEMMRKIETEAIALGLGLGLVGFIAWNQLLHAGAGFSDSIESSNGPLMPFLAGYLVARVIVYLRYR